MLNGNYWPSIIREQEDHFVFLGNCYIDQIMYWQQVPENVERELESKQYREFAFQ